MEDKPNARRPTAEQCHRFPELFPPSPDLGRDGQERRPTHAGYLCQEHFPDSLPDPYPAELEAMLPRAFRLEDNDVGLPEGYEPEK